MSKLTNIKNVSAIANSENVKGGFWFRPNYYSPAPVCAPAPQKPTCYVAPAPVCAPKPVCAPVSTCAPKISFSFSFGCW